MRVHLYFAVSKFSTWVIIWSVLTWSTQCWLGHAQDPGWVIDKCLWLMIIYGLQVSTRHIHTLDGVFYFILACIIFMIIITYRIYYYYCSNIDGASDVPLWWTYGVWVLIPISWFWHSESIGATGFHFRAFTGHKWVSWPFCSNFS